MNSILKYIIPTARVTKMDFNKPWWSILFKEKLTLLWLFIFSSIDNAAHTLIPMVFGYALSTQSYTALAGITIMYATIRITRIFLYDPKVTQLMSFIVDSFSYSAYSHFLRLDPMHHATKPSGMVIGKIKRTTTSYLDISFSLEDQLVPYCIEIVTVITAMFIVNTTLGIFAIGMIGILTCAFTASMYYATTPLEDAANLQEDIVNQTCAESLTQLPLIRSTFATDRVNDKLYTVHRKYGEHNNRLWTTYSGIRGIFVVAYILLMCLFCAYLIHLTLTQGMTTVFATTVFLTFARASRVIFKLDSTLKIVNRSYRRIKDFFDYIHKFGEQGYPVLKSDSEAVAVTKSAETTISVNQIEFAYPDHERTFNQFSLKLDVSNDQPNKLYGIIGESGIGKTTLLSLLGGQLKPQSGTITIDGIDIYAVNDATRKQLIAIQNQSASNIRGTLKKNLLLGLPAEYSPSDEDLVNLLKSVGIWHIFEAKLGLTTLIGESGLNLSGGQRQRLNFANLYLRARYFKPALILIDEPTSSLDEVSERTITLMIKELATEHVTLVIAHRLKTLDDAVAIFDFSLLKPNSSLLAHAPSELQEISRYYRQLHKGLRDTDENLTDTIEAVDATN